ncbi:MAG: hypothetical protein PHX64_02290 [Candidatus Omnitrophica bacterium]|nr:hypothetical protein [Candidatus Omnitrophota bacterium]MDD5310564.1 hypothetical protein [Candidatus Omnitrophota bacterium]MDD5546010.1 hypothetical protein [Candidatus Omnitrophota bacterium]
MNNRFLSGNYKIKTKKSKSGKKPARSHTGIFEEKATEKLGGSIAFVMKSNKFIWDADEKAK